MNWNTSRSSFFVLGNNNKLPTYDNTKIKLREKKVNDKRLSRNMEAEVK